MTLPDLIKKEGLEILAKRLGMLPFALERPLTKREYRTLHAKTEVRMGVILEPLPRS